MPLALGAFALGGCESERDRKLEERIAAAEARAAAAEKRAAAAENAAGSTSPVSTETDPDAAPLDPGEDQTAIDPNDGSQTAAELAPDEPPADTVFQPPADTLAGPIDVGKPPAAS